MLSAHATSATIRRSDEASIFSIDVRLGDRTGQASKLFIASFLMVLRHHSHPQACRYCRSFGVKLPIWRPRARTACRWENGRPEPEIELHFHLESAAPYSASHVVLEVLERRSSGLAGGRRLTTQLLSGRNGAASFVRRKYLPRRMVFSPGHPIGGWPGSPWATRLAYHLASRLLVKSKTST